MDRLGEAIGQGKINFLQGELYRLERRGYISPTIDLGKVVETAREQGKLGELFDAVKKGLLNAPPASWLQAGLTLLEDLGKEIGSPPIERVYKKQLAERVLGRIRGGDLSYVSIARQFRAEGLYEENTGSR